MRRGGYRKAVAVAPDDLVVLGGDIIGSDVGEDTQVTLTDSRAQVVVDGAVKVDVQPTTISMSVGSGEGLTIHSSGAATFATPLRTVSANDTLTTNDGIVMLDTSGGAITLTLPAASTIESGRMFLLKDSGSAGSHAVTVQCASSTIDGDGSITINENSVGVSLFSDGTNWFIF
tara:strand:- start:748 stop:1269 length:522 start_codon:yes stop_codon:yes gene_type:complete